MIDLENTDDEQLILLVQQGNQRAFQTLFARYRTRVSAAAFSVLRNREDAIEVVQEAFIRVYQNIDKYQKGTHFYTWLYQITRNLAIDRYRRKKTANEIEFDSDFQRNYTRPDEVLPPSLGINPQKAIERTELRQRLSAAIDSLSPKHREIIVLREFDGLQYEEIAECLGISIGTVMSRLFNARHNLQEALREYSNDEV